MTSRKQPWSISQLNQVIKQNLSAFPAIWVAGEISNLVKARSGHYYFTLKDPQAQVACAWFRGQQHQSQIALSEGLQVCALAQPTLYEPRGNYQLIIQQVEAIGSGALHQAFEALKKKLDNEGLFDQKHKLALPKIPKTIGVITSPSGAALRDIKAVLKRRFPMARIIVYPAVVQGVAAPSSLLNALSNAIQHALADVLILARGGGAYEDLIGFNDESLARAIYECPIPTISGVGHEIDFTITDFVADARGATPSEAAESCTPSQAQLQQQLLGYWQIVNDLMRLRIDKHQQALQHLANRCRHPSQTLATQQQALDHLDLRLTQAWQKYTNQQQHQLALYRQRLEQSNPKIRINMQRQHCLHQLQQLLITLQHKHHAAEQTLQNFSAKLHALSPLATLARGYAIVKDNQGQVLLNANKAKPGDAIHIQLADGQLSATINSQSK